MGERDIQVRISFSPCTHARVHIRMYSCVEDYLFSDCSNLSDRAVIYAKKHSARHIVDPLIHLTENKLGDG
jgi:hypothetical protein